MIFLQGTTTIVCCMGTRRGHVALALRLLITPLALAGFIYGNPDLGSNEISITSRVCGAKGNIRVPWNAGVDRGRITT